MSHDPLVVTLICSPASTCPPEWSEADEPDPTDTEIWDALYSKAGDLVSYAATFGLSILMLQPLNQFDGWHEGSKRGEWVKRKALVLKARRRAAPSESCHERWDGTDRRSVPMTMPRPMPQIMRLRRVSDGSHSWERNRIRQSRSLTKAGRSAAGR
jgi:hypothetical protein